MSLLLQAVECSDQKSDDAMPLFTTDGIVTITGGAQAGDAPNLGIRRVWTDSRTVRRGDQFVALTGARFDGHQFVSDALRKGAVGAIVRRGFVGAGGASAGPHPARKAPWKALLIEVEDPLRAFQELARAHRRRFAIPVVAVSGSNGKTTTKEMIGAILAADAAFFKDLAARVRGQVRSFGFSERADVRALQVERRGLAFSFVRVGVRGRARPLSVTLGVAGAHNIANALAAIATGLALGIGESAIRAGLARFRPTAMRSEVRRWRGVTWLNDCYNANPSSMRAALRWLAELKGELKGNGRAIAVLGDMLELGEGSVRIHRDIGEELARQGTDYLLTVGDLAAEIAAGARGAGMPVDRVIVTQEHAALAERLKDILRAGDVVLLKGSRGTRMECVLEELA